MFNFFLETQNFPFAISITLMLLIAIVEGVGMIFGAGISGVIDNLFPDLDFSIDAPDLDSSSGLTQFLGWLRFGEVPVFIILIVFLLTFGIVGLTVQSVCQNLTGKLLPAFVATIPVLLCSMPIVRILTGMLGHILPQDETYAVSQDDFIGLAATITLGTTIVGQPTRAKLKDKFGTTHYIMIEPDEEGKRYEHGASVLIVCRVENIFKVIENTTEVFKN